MELRPERDVDVRDGRFVATSAEPWLTLDPASSIGLAGCFVELTYRASLWDEPVRPVFRFWCSQGRFVERIAVGPVAGAGLWTGRLPAGTTRISVSPTIRPGPFGFRIERLRRRAGLALLAEGFRRNPKAARSALLTRLIGWRAESDVNLTWATSSTPLRDYAAWHAVRSRSIDLEDLDRPRFDWSTSAPIHVVVTEGPDLDRTLASLRAQVFPFWTATVLGTCEAGDPRIAHGSAAMASQHVGTLGDGAIICVVRAGGVMPAHALAHVAEQAHRYPSCRLFYGDALVKTPLQAMKSSSLNAFGQGDPRPLATFQPGWSPRLFAAPATLQAPLFVRGPTAWSDESRRRFIEGGELPTSFMAMRTDARPLRRILLTAKAEPETCVARAAPACGRARAAIIIPTRDHPALLRRVVASIRARPGPFQIVIVDNASATKRARALLAELRGAPDVLCLDHPAPFNFSLMCNEAAAAATGDVLVFLNDDTEIISEDWLARLVAQAITPGVGAVGGKLTYPDGRLQHIGVLVGMGGTAGHFGARDPPGAPGWAGRNGCLHEVSAVTGACLAVARDKFEAVGGFDAEQLPVELNDVDLCLKLNERGWQTVVDPEVRLMHEESASRGGATFRRLAAYESQRAVFFARWRHVLRDDPVFHPGLSLYSWQAALG